MTPVEGVHGLYTRAAVEAAAEPTAEGGFVPGSNQASVFGVGIAFSVLALAVMALRLHARLVIVKGALGVDDCKLLLNSHPARACLTNSWKT